MWALTAYAVYRLVTRAGPRAAAAMLALAVLSHWLLDFVAHLPDLDLVSESHKVGLGLWFHPLVETMLEGALVVAGLTLYFRGSPRLALGRRVARGTVPRDCSTADRGSFGPPPPSVRAMAAGGLALHLLAALALARAAEGPVAAED